MFFLIYTWNFALIIYISPARKTHRNIAQLCTRKGWALGRRGGKRSEARSSWFCTSSLPSQEAQHHHNLLNCQKVWSSLEVLVISCRVDYREMMQEKTLSVAQFSWSLHVYKPLPTHHHCLNTWYNFEIFVRSYTVECREKLKRRLSYPKGTKAGLFRAFFQEFYALWVLYLNRMFLRYGPDQKTKNYTFTLSSCSCWIPQSWQRLKSQLLACVKRGWFYRKATRSLLLCLIFPFSQQLGTSWLATFADEVVWVWFPVLFTFSWQCSLLQDQEDGL